MKKMMNWFIGKTKVGKGVSSAQDFLDGYKAYIAGAAMMIPGVLNLILDFQRDGLPALTDLGHNPNYRLMLEGWGLMALRAGVAKVQRVSEVGAAEATVAAEKK